MPCIGICNQALNENENGVAVTYGSKKGIDTDAFSEGDTAYVSATEAGKISAKPIDSTLLIQNVGIVTKKSTNNGALFVTGIGRSNDIPNAPTNTEISSTEHLYMLKDSNNRFDKITSDNLAKSIETYTREYITGSEPTSNVPGNIVYNINTNKLKYYNDNHWETIAEVGDANSFFSTGNQLYESDISTISDPFVDLMYKNTNNLSSNYWYYNSTDPGSTNGKFNLYFYANTSTANQLTVGDIKALYFKSQIIQGYSFINIYTISDTPDPSEWYKYKITFSISNNTSDKQQTLYFYNNGTSTSIFPEMISKQLNIVKIYEFNSPPNTPTTLQLNDILTENIRYITLQSDSATTTEKYLSNFGFITNTEKQNFKFNIHPNFEKFYYETNKSTSTTCNSSTLTILTLNTYSNYKLYTNKLLITKTSKYLINIDLRYELISSTPIEFDIEFSIYTPNSLEPLITTLDSTTVLYSVKDKNNGEDNTYFKQINFNKYIKIYANKLVDFEVQNNMSSDLIVSNYTINLIEV